MKILFNSGMAFQYRSLLPVMKQLCEDGVEVFVLSKGHFSENRIRKKPRSFGDVTESSLKFVCSQIGLSHDFLSSVRFVRVFGRFGLPTSRFYRSINLFVSTTKGFPWLNSMAEFGKPRIAIGYQNFLGTYFYTRSGKFPNNCPPDLTYEKKVRETINAEWIEAGLPFLDSYVKRYKITPVHSKNSRNKVLLLHPGGYRNVLTRMGESKAASYQKQREFYKSILDYIPADMSLYVKMHPLAARYHDKASHEDFASDLELTPIEGFLGDILFDFDAVLSLGSSSLFEIVPFGIPLWVLNYFSKERTQLYSELPGLLIDNDKELKEKLYKREKQKFIHNFEIDFTQRLFKVADGHATDRVMQVINNCLS